MRLAAALGAFAVGGDVYAGANAGENAAEYNSLGLLRKAYKIARVLREKGRNTTWRDLADAVGSAEDLRTITNANASGIERIIAAVSLAGDLWFGVSARDLDNLRNIIRRGDDSVPNLNTDGTLRNLYTGDPVRLLTPPRKLVKDSSGRYWLESATGNRITPSGTYDFVTLPNGSIRVARNNSTRDPGGRYSTHLGLSGGGDVNYAGTVTFNNNSSPNRGNIVLVLPQRSGPL